MSDTFEDHPALTTIRETMLPLLASEPAVDWLLLTKRPENVMQMVPPQWRTHWPEHVWIGTTVEDQAAADVRVPVLCQIPATVRFLSMEPLLQEVRLDAISLGTRHLGGGKTERATYDLLKPILVFGDEGDLEFLGIDWVIAGGESGRGARPSHPDWFRSLRDQCASAGVPFFFKQWGEWTSAENLSRGGRLKCAWFTGDEWKVETQTDRQSENCHADDSPDVYRMGKKSAGRLLDGVEHNAIP